MMKVSKLMLCALGATIVTSATAFGASASTIDGRSATGNSLSPMLISVQPAAVEKHAAVEPRVQIALNPQPLPPGIVDEDRFEW
ncbi:MAG: hypothetical protein ACLP8A_06250 [Methylovirgula sp.]